VIVYAYPGWPLATKRLGGVENGIALVLAVAVQEHLRQVTLDRRHA
jgi:hypothetical protein